MAEVATSSKPCKPTPEQVEAWKKELTRNFEKRLKDFPELLELTIKSYLSDPEIFEQEGRELREKAQIDKQGYANFGIDIIGAEDSRYAEVVKRLDDLAREHVSGGQEKPDAGPLNDAINSRSTNNDNAVSSDNQGASS